MRKNMDIANILLCFCVKFNLLVICWANIPQCCRFAAVLGNVTFLGQLVIESESFNGRENTSPDSATRKVLGRERISKAPTGWSGYFLCAARSKALSGNYKAAGPPILFLFLRTDRCLQQAQRKLPFSGRRGGQIVFSESWEVAKKYSRKVLTHLLTSPESTIIWAPSNPKEVPIWPSLTPK